MLSNFSKVLKNYNEEELYLRFVTCCVTKKENQIRGPQMNSPTLPQKNFQIFCNFTCSYS